MKRGFRAALGLVAPLAAALAPLAGAREAAAWAPLDLDVVPRWRELPARYHINGGTIPGPLSGFAAASIEAGFAAWSSPGCTAWEAELLGDTGDGYDFDDGKSVFLWISDGWPGELGQADSVIAVTMPVWDADGVIGEADMIFNNVGFCWNDTGDGDCIDVRSIATHEEGHFLGLGHTSVRGATMLGFYPGGTSARTLEEDDIEGVCALYPIAGTGAASSGGGGSGAGAMAASGGAGGAASGSGDRPKSGNVDEAEGDAGCSCSGAGQPPIAPGALPMTALGALLAFWCRRPRRTLRERQRSGGVGERAPRVVARTGALYNPAQPGQTSRHARAEHRSVRGGGRACPPLP
ncbi:matrixin family metalloprotease [Sorangium sp. So ce1504]|uniref:matrixin family metalloprotease n=1 Tax=Sorangium sp. So ce1504 TaxID=3133337 RepID=UPI003F61AD63